MDIMDCDYEDDAGNCSSPHGCYCAEIAAAVLRDEKAAALIASQARRIAELEGAATDALASLVAVVSLLERGGKRAAPSDKMFAVMLADYNASIERARATLKGEMP